MTRRVFLDAMAQRADLAVEADENQSPAGNPSFIIDNLQSGSIVAASLRKPDFQRETNQWTPKQVVGFLESFLDGELVPAVILWRSKSYTYVIDGGHRLSALRAWIENDYGAGTISQEFFNYEITAEQKRVHTVTQKLVDEKIGPFKTYREAVLTRQKTGKLPPLPPTSLTALEVSRSRTFKPNGFRGMQTRLSLHFSKSILKAPRSTILKSCCCETGSDPARSRHVQSFDRVRVTSTGRSFRRKISRK